MCFVYAIGELMLGKKTKKHHITTRSVLSENMGILIVGNESIEDHHCRKSTELGLDGKVSPKSLETNQIQTKKIIISCIFLIVVFLLLPYDIAIGHLFPYAINF